MTELTLTEEQQRALSALVSKVDGAAIRFAGAGRERDPVALYLLPEYKEYERAYRTLWAAVGGRF